MTSYNERTSRRRHARGSDFNMSVNGIMNMVTRKPEALLLVGAGLALLMRNGRGFSLSGLGTPSRSHGGQDHRDHRSGVVISRMVTMEALGRSLQRELHHLLAKSRMRRVKLCMTFAKAQARWRVRQLKA